MELVAKLSKKVGKQAVGFKVLPAFGVTLYTAFVEEFYRDECVGEVSWSVYLFFTCLIIAVAVEHAVTLLPAFKYSGKSKDLKFKPKYLVWCWIQGLLAGLMMTGYALSFRNGRPFSCGVEWNNSIFAAIFLGLTILCIGLKFIMQTFVFKDLKKRMQSLDDATGETAMVKPAKSSATDIKKAVRANIPILVLFIHEVVVRFGSFECGTFQDASFWVYIVLMCILSALFPLFVTKKYTFQIAKKRTKDKGGDPGAMWRNFMGLSIVVTSLEVLLKLVVFFTWILYTTGENQGVRCFISQDSFFERQNSAPVFFSVAALLIMVSVLERLLLRLHDSKAHNPSNATKIEVAPIEMKETPNGKMEAPKETKEKESSPREEANLETSSNSVKEEKEK